MLNEKIKSTLSKSEDEDDITVLKGLEGARRFTRNSAKPVRRNPSDFGVAFSYS
jgi:hypothetical protein